MHAIAHITRATALAHDHAGAPRSAGRRRHRRAITRQAATANAAFLAYAPAPAGPALGAVPRRHRRQRDARHRARARLGDRTGRRHRQRRRPADARHDRRRRRRRRRPRRPGRLAAPEDRLRPRDRRPQPGPVTELPVRRLRRRHHASAPNRSPDATVAAIVLPLASKIPPTPDQADAFAERGRPGAGEGDLDPRCRRQRARRGAAARQPARRVRRRRRRRQPRGVPVQRHHRPDVLRARLRDRSDQHRRRDVLLRQRHVAGLVVRRRRARRAAQLRPSTTPARAVELLLSTTRNGHLDVAAAFRAAGLGAIVDAGTAAIPKPPAAAAPDASPAPARPRPRRPRDGCRGRASSARRGAAACSRSR